MGLESVSHGGPTQLFLFCLLLHQTGVQCQVREDWPQKGLVRDQKAKEDHGGLHLLQSSGKFHFYSRLQHPLAGILE